MTLYTIKEDRMEGNWKEVSFGLKDPWNRSVGARIYSFRAAWFVTESNPSESVCNRDSIKCRAAELNEKPFAAFCYQIRDGESYGGGNVNPRYFATAEERASYVDRYLKNAKRNAEKTVAKQAAVRARRQAKKGN